MRREDSKKGGKSVKKEDSKFVEKKSADYPNRYKGELAPKKDIEQVKPGNYKDDRYK
jgi:hypothetical protein